MRVTCSRSAEGAIYRLYRSSDGFVVELRSLIPLLQEMHCDVAIGGSEDDPAVVLIVGPLGQNLDEAFRRRVQRFMA